MPRSSSVRHGLQQIQPLHDRGEERSSPVSGPDLQHGPPSVLHYFPNHGVEEIPDYCSWNSPERFFIFHGRTL